MAILRGQQIEPYSLDADRLSNTASSIISTISNIDLNTTGTTTLLTATNKTLILGVLLRATSADSVTSAPQVSIGVNAEADNIFAEEALVSLDSKNDMYVFWSLGTGVTILPTEELDLYVNVASSSVQLVVTAYIIGLI